MRSNIKVILRIFYILLSFAGIDVWLRVLTKDIGLYDVWKLPPNLFTFFWSLIIVNLLFYIHKHKIAKIVYGVLYFICCIYVIIQYGYYLIFGKFLFLSDFLFAGEGTDYLSYVLDIITIPVVIQIILLVSIGIIGILVFPDFKSKNRKKEIGQGIVVLISIVGLFITPNLYNTLDDVQYSEGYQNHAFEYSRFVNSAYDMQLTGVYQYVARDTYQNINKRFGNEGVQAEAINEIETYFSEKAVSKSNDMTGVFAGKNVIIVMMESIDDWLITEEDMPTINYMMQNGIDFSNMYTPNYSSGYTINTEFAFNTSIYPLSTENFVYTLVENDFKYSIANIFNSNGYKVNSFHYNHGEFYNRKELHKAFGYEEYVSYYNYSDEVADVADDRFVYLCDDLYAKIINANDSEKTPFMSFVITMSAHLPYASEDANLALQYHPEYKEADGELSEDAVLRVKARLTDDMFAGLLKRLDEDNLLEDTVIVGFADHYSYGLTNDELLQNLSTAAGNSILEHTPAFIYCAGMEESIVVDDVTQITDLAPTVENLFGFDVPKEIMGYDVFDENFEGYAVFPNNTWITNMAYMKNGELIYDNGMSDVEMLRMNEFVQSTYLVNDYLLEYDYYDILNEYE